MKQYEMEDMIFPLEKILVDAVNYNILPFPKRDLGAWKNFDDVILNQLNSSTYLINDVLKHYDLDLENTIDSFLSLLCFDEDYDFGDFIVSNIKESFTSTSFGLLSFKDFVLSLYSFVFYSFSIKSSMFSKYGPAESRISIVDAMDYYSSAINDNFSTLEINSFFYSKFIFKLAFDKNLKFADYVTEKYYRNSTLPVSELVNNYIRDYNIFYQDMIENIVNNSMSNNPRAIIFNYLQAHENVGLQSKVFWNNVHNLLDFKVNEDFISEIDNQLYHFGERFQYENINSSIQSLYDKLSFSVLTCLFIYNYIDNKENIDVEYIMNTAFQCSRDKIININVKSFVTNSFEQSNTSNEKIALNIMISALL